jgi:hypothetical protein
MARTRSGFAMSAQKIKTKLKNDMAFATYYSQLKHLAVISFKWNNLPDDIDPVFLEEMLYQYGMVAVFKDPVVGLVALPAIQAGGFTITNMPKMVRAFSPRTGFSQLLKYSPALESTECVLIHNTNRDLNSSLFKSIIGTYAERLADMKRTEDVNVYAQRTPITMVVPEGQVETYTNLLDRYNNFGQVVFGYKGLDVDAVKSLNTEAPFVANLVDELFVKTWNEAVSFLGISSVGVSKRERVTLNESLMSMGSTVAFRQVRQEPREWAISRINEKWGTDISIDFEEIYRNNEKDLSDNVTDQQNLLAEEEIRASVEVAKEKALAGIVKENATND